MIIPVAIIPAPVISVPIISVPVILVLIIPVSILMSVVVGILFRLITSGLLVWFSLRQVREVQEVVIQSAKVLKASLVLSEALLIALAIEDRAPSSC